MVRNKQSQKSGFSLIEVMFLIIIVSISLVGLMNVQTSAQLADEANEEDIYALQACEQKIEELRDAAIQDFSTFYDDYNASSANNGFAVEGLTVQEDDLDGLCGRIIFPESNGTLDETNPDADPDWDPTVLDMDADGDTTEANLDYADVDILQIKVVVEYKSVTGNNRNRKLIATIYGSN